MIFLGLDTSNYTTSAALYNSETGEMIMSRRLLDVEQGSLGLRQSDALFLHVKRLPEILEGLGGLGGLAAVAASTRPREVEGSYMPCFLAGETVARAIAHSHGIPFFPFSHQQGHIAAGIWSAGKTELMGRECLVLHISGGTSEMLYVTPSVNGKHFTASAIGGSSDLAVGQLVDRCGKLIGLGFPAGPELEALAVQSVSMDAFAPKMDGLYFSVSGLENKLKKLVDDGTDSRDIARFTINSATLMLSRLIEKAREDVKYKDLPLLCVGGVMSNSIIRRELEGKYGAVFCGEGFSSDNAAGVAWLASKMLASKTLASEAID